MHYILKDKEAIPADFKEWLNWIAKHDDEKKDWRRVRLDQIGEAKISTVFLGIDHAHGHPVPLVFETMVFGGVNDQFQERYTTWEEASRGHAYVVKMIEAGGYITSLSDET